VRRAAPMLAWAALLLALAVMLALWTSDLVAIALLPAAVVVVLVVAACAVRARDRDERELPEASASAILGAGGLALLALGAVAGLWAALVGAGLVIVAIVAAVRERWG
jgi:Ca2+/Na+ antiporter